MKIRNIINIAAAWRFKYNFICQNKSVELDWPPYYNGQ